MMAAVMCFAQMDWLEPRRLARFSRAIVKGTLAGLWYGPSSEL